MALEYEVTLTVKVDNDFFYWNLSEVDRQEQLKDTLLNALYDLDDVKVKSIQTEELNK
tara:strand:- start:11510 stop:11683 length:174 start_codon:yes stop_codon:yes gene_type:complete